MTIYPIIQGNLNIFLGNSIVDVLNFSLANLGDFHNDGDSLKAGNMEEGMSTTIGEVLDLTHNQLDPFKLHFDDTNWQKHLPSLKPLGLSILLNTCNLDTQVLLYCLL